MIFALSIAARIVGISLAAVTSQIWRNRRLEVGSATTARRERFLRWSHRQSNWTIAGGLIVGAGFMILATALDQTVR